MQTTMDKETSAKRIGRIGFIGAGKAGVTLGKYFTMHQIPVSGYASREFASAKEAAQFTDSKAYQEVGQLIAESDTLFFTVPDGQIKSVWEQVRNCCTDKIVCHASGSLSSAVFCDGQGRTMGFSVHPLCAMSDKWHSYEQIASCLFTVEGSDDVVCEALTALLRSCGNEVERIDAEQKPLYHAAAVVVSNFVTGLSYLGSKMLRECGFSGENAEKALLPLLQSSVSNIARQGSVKALTGPVERGDTETVKRHFKAFSKMPDTAMRDRTEEVYRAMTKVLIEMASEKKGKNQAEQWKEIIKNGKEYGSNVSENEGAGRKDYDAYGI